MKTALEGPATREEQKGDGSCPTIVLKLEAREDASVVLKDRKEQRTYGIGEEKFTSDVQKKRSGFAGDV